PGHLLPDEGCVLPSPAATPASFPLPSQGAAARDVSRTGPYARRRTADPPVEEEHHALGLRSALCWARRRARCGSRFVGAPRWSPRHLARTPARMVPSSLTRASWTSPRQLSRSSFLVVPTRATRSSPSTNLA